ncbi:MAG: DUF488 domain-containing protein [Bacteroidota bacterium]|nr:DUF488 domain-containing protein [Bacteroidota bacterium]
MQLPVQPESLRIWTIGHSTRTIEGFMELLKRSKIQQLVDVRSYPGSRRYPHFNREALAGYLAEAGIAYIHSKDLGGRRKPAANSKNNAWRNDAFRGYADYMETGTFHEAIRELKTLAETTNTAYMCSEALWWKCHRSLISDYLKAEGWEIQHIMENNEEKHPFTSAARIESGKLTYANKTLF